MIESLSLSIKPHPGKNCDISCSFVSCIRPYLADYKVPYSFFSYKSLRCRIFSNHRYNYFSIEWFRRYLALLFAINRSIL